ncbi:unnamed protein product [Symbiodinium sp. CCMP2456]|nr:unnamed protein product [Symbiodinium sp. CCMP2456]
MATQSSSGQNKGFRCRPPRRGAPKASRPIDGCEIQFMVMTKLQLPWAFTFWSVLQVAVLNASRFTGQGQGSSLERGEAGQGASGVDAALPPPTLEEWLSTLSLQHAQARADAANELGKLGNEAAEAIPKLTELLQDDREAAGDIYVQDAAVKALGHMGSAAASSVPEMFKQLRRQSTSSFEEGVAFALANIGQEAPEAVLPSVLESLKASEWYVRWVAASACGLLGEKAAAFVPQLRQLAKYDPESMVRSVASQSLSDMSKVITLPAPNLTDWLEYLDGTDPQARADAANELGKLGKEAAEAIPKLTELLQDDREVAGDICVQDAAVKALGHMGSAAASSVPAMFKQLRFQSTRSFREGVAFALANIGQEAPEAVLPSVLESLKASMWYVRWVAASACGLLGEKAAAFVPQLRQLAKYDPESMVRSVASQSLSDMSKVITLPAPNLTDWLEYLDGTDRQARADAANELGKLGKEAAEAVPKLTELLQDDREVHVAGDICVQDAAVKALGHMGSAAASSVPAMFKQLRFQSTRSFREGAAVALANIGQEAPEAVLPSVLESLKAEKWYVRWVAASACGLLGEKAAAFVPQLRQLAKYDPESMVRSEAQKALDLIDKVISVRTVMRFLALSRTQPNLLEKGCVCARTQRQMRPRQADIMDVVRRRTFFQSSPAEPNPGENKAKVASIPKGNLAQRGVSAVAGGIDNLTGSESGSGIASKAADKLGIGKPKAGPAWRLQSWDIHARDKCEPWLIGYALGKFRGANQEAQRLVFRLLPGPYWSLLQRLDQLAEPLAIRTANGERPTNDDIRRLANVMYETDQIKRGSMWDTDMTDQGARMWGELAHDEALRIAHAIRRVQSFGRFLFSVSFPCAPTEGAYDLPPTKSMAQYF